MSNELEEWLKEEKPYYYKLIKLKEKGELFPFEDIDFEELKTLWWYEKKSDNSISELFNLNSPRTVTHKRNKWNIKQSACIQMDMIREITGGI